ncbi:MAG: response regulator transcription factor [Haliscomenobacter sp.]|nr:LytTR family DNA-binding domain-containing protein [Haliscomenobacter sp.]MBK9491803.1 response regulator transcription factor [Haliscomenobacter sp.]
MIKIFLVDDEYLALNLLEAYVQQVPDLELVGKEKLPMKALERIQQEPIDLLFLDIQMPVLSGNNLLKTLQNPPLVVFTTAYTEYAIEAYDLNVVDYLLKPFPFERFLQAVQKAKQVLQARQTPSDAPTSPNFLSLKVDGKLVKVVLEDILYIEGLKEYVRFVCTGNRKYVTLESLRNLEEQLPSTQFSRVHKSYIVANNKVSALDGNMLEIGTVKIPISRGKREDVVAEIFKPF